MQVQCRENRAEVTDDQLASEGAGITSCTGSSWVVERRQRRERRDAPMDRKPPSLPMLRMLLLLPMLRIDAKLPTLSNDAALATDSTLHALSTLQRLRWLSDR